MTGPMPAGFGAFATLTALVVALGLAILILRARGRPLRGPGAAFGATVALYVLLVLAREVGGEAAGSLLRLADTWAPAWAPIALLLWWAASRR